MSAILQSNIDTSYSLHMQELELEALLVLLSVVSTESNTPHAKAVGNMFSAISKEIGPSKFKRIDDNVIVTLCDNDDSEEWELSFE